MKQVTLRDIASRIGVSINTVSLALKDSDRVAPDTRRKIRLCAQELGYIPNAAAQTLVTRRSGLIGVALGTRSDFRDDMFLGMVEQARHFGYDVMVSSETDDPVQIVRAFQKRLTEGVVVLLSEEKAVLLAEHVRSTRIPHVFILGERPRTNIRGPWVAVDNYMGAYQAVSHLVQSGIPRGVDTGICLCRDRRVRGGSPGKFGGALYERVTVSLPRSHHHHCG